MYRSNIRRTTLTLVVLLAVLAMSLVSFKAVPVNAEEAAATVQNTESDTLQFTSAGQVLSFNGQGVMIASASHLLRTEFVNANLVEPQSDDTTSAGNLNGAANAFSRVTYNGLWKGVDVVYEASLDSILKSTYNIAPEDITGSVEQIRLLYNRPLSLDKCGNLVTSFDTGSLTESKPAAWQEIGEAKKAVIADYRIYPGNEVGFILGDYVPGIPLVIDPALTWNTFLGSNGTDFGLGITLDGSGNVYVTGGSNATWQGGSAPLHAISGGEDVFVAKLTAAGVLTWNTFLGGNGNDEGWSIAVDNSGNIYVTGWSTASWQGTSSPLCDYNGGDEDIFVVGLTANGTLTWNTFLGGTGTDEGRSIALDNSGNVYFSGYSDAAWQGTSPPLRAYDSAEDVFIAKITVNSGGGGGGGGAMVGGSFAPVNKLAVVAPWLGLGLILILGGTGLVLRRRKNN